MKINETTEGIEEIARVLRDYRENVVTATARLTNILAKDDSPQALKICELVEQIRNKTEALEADVTRCAELKAKAVREYNALAYRNGRI